MIESEKYKWELSEDELSEDTVKILYKIRNSRPFTLCARLHSPSTECMLKIICLSGSWQVERNGNTWKA